MSAKNSAKRGPGMNKQIIKYIILAVSIIAILASGYLIYRNVFPDESSSSVVTQNALERIETRITSLESLYKEAKKDAHKSAERVEREVSTLAPDDVAVELSALLGESRSERRDRVYPEGVDQSD